jgi:hypothetical protein
VCGEEKGGLVKNNLAFSQVYIFHQDKRVRLGGG